MLHGQCIESKAMNNNEDELSRVEIDVKDVKIGFAHFTRDWVLLPKEVNVHVSRDGKRYTKYSADLPLERRFILSPFRSIIRDISTKINIRRYF